MKRTALLLVLVLLSALACPAFVSAGMLVDLGTAAPTPGANDQFYLPATGLRNSNLYTNDAPGATLAFGESFTTGVNATGYTLTSFVLNVGFNYQYGSNTLTLPFSINRNPGASNTLVATDSGSLTETALGSDGGISGHYLQFIFATPVTLSPLTQYSFTLGGQTNSGGGATVFSGTSDDGYAGGAVISNDTDNTSVVADFVFDVGLTAVMVPEPSTMIFAGILLVGYCVRKRFRGLLAKLGLASV